MDLSSCRCLVALVFALLAGCATPGPPPPPRTAAPPVPVDFTIGPAVFHGGDSIRIDEVDASSPDLKTGDRVVVRGWYDLHSRDSADLRLYLTSFHPPPYRPVGPAPHLAVRRGVGPFQLEWVIPGGGALHVSFYPSHGGISFGDVYFGSDVQMDWIRELYVE